MMGVDDGTLREEGAEDAFQAALRAQVGRLASGGMKAMAMMRIKIAAVGMAIALTGSSFGAAADREPAEPQATKAKPAVVPDEAKRSFEKLSALLRPLPGEYDWRDAVPWQTRIQTARQLAVKEDKPLLIFSCANAFVLGRT